LGLKRKSSLSRVFCLMSDGECDEGSVWDAAMFASHHKINNLVAIIDYNKIQSLEKVSSTLSLEPFKDKWESFGWCVIEVDGHNHDELKSAIAITTHKKNSPLLVLAHTTKGKGVSFMENTVLWHYRSPQNEEFSKAMSELSGE